MPRVAFRTTALLAAICLASGCSFFAKKTPTPAAQLDGKTLANTPVPEGEHYYLILFGSHNPLHQPKYSHTWGTLVKATTLKDNPEPSLEVHTISWLPTDLDINPTSLRVEPGTNVELHATIKNSLDTRQTIYMWGPYEVSYPLSVRFLTQKAFLESGAVGYQCTDTIGEAARLGNGCDCIHAITDMDPVYPRSRYPLTFYGRSATANLVRRIMHSPVTIDGPKTHDWILCRLGLNEYPIEKVKYRGRVIPYEPGRGDLDVAPAAPVPGAPVEPKTPTPKTAPGIPANNGKP
jgi:hypothetical protein